LIITTLFFFKFESSLGRSLIIWGCKDLILDNWLFGSGMYGFTSTYMDWQSEYFQSNPNSNFASYAGNVMHPLNEYASLLICYGALGFIALMAIITSIIYNCRKNINVWAICVLAISIQSFFTYTFRYAFVWFFVGLCLSQITLYKSFSLKIPIMHLFSIAAFLFCLYSLTMNIQQVKFEYRWWKALNNLIDTHDTQKSLDIYSELSDKWTSNPFFFYNLASVQHLNLEFDESNNTLNRYNLYIVDYNSAILRADNFYYNGEYEKAVEAYKRASFMCPSKFTPLQGLLNSYYALNDSVNLRSISEKIINKPIKIKSRQIDIIKAEAQNYLK